MEIGIKNKNIVLGVCGGIAAYKAVELLRLLVKEGANVRVVMTESSQWFVGALTFKALSGNPVASASAWTTATRRFCFRMAWAILGRACSSIPGEASVKTIPVTLSVG